MLVSGNPGAGKSTLAAELRRRGLRAYDSDAVPGLAAWMDSSGAVVGDSTLEPTPELLADCSWAWSASRLDEVVAELGPRGILLGIAVNQWDFVDRFDALVLLELDDDTQRSRVADRDPLFRQQIIAGLPELQRRMIDRGARRLDAADTTASIADRVTALIP
jgi:hypothetical protein